MATEAIEYEGETRPRSRWLAAALTMVCPGLGFVYVGQLLKGVTVNLLFLLMLESFVIVFSILKFFPLLPFLVIMLAWLIFSGFAARSVVGQIDAEEPYVLRGYNHWTIYSVIFLLTFVVPIGATAQFIGTYLLDFDHVATSAMYPTIQAGDTVLVDMSAYRNAPPKRGDLVAVQPDGDDDFQILRVVGVQGDRIKIESENVFVNGEPLERSELDKKNMVAGKLEGDGDYLALVEHNHGNRYVISVSPRAFNAARIPQTRLEQGQFFVLADNRSQVPKDREKDIRDSRNFGPVPLEAIEGEPVYIAWSTDPSTGETRWDRIGLRTQ